MSVFCFCWSSWLELTRDVRCHAMCNEMTIGGWLLAQVWFINPWIQFCFSVTTGKFIPSSMLVRRCPAFHGLVVLICFWWNAGKTQNVCFTYPCELYTCGLCSVSDCISRHCSFFSNKGQKSVFILLSLLLTSSLISRTISFNIMSSSFLVKVFVSVV